MISNSSKYTKIIRKPIYHKTPMLLFTKHERFGHMGVSNRNLRDLFFLTENWRCNYKSTVWFQDYMRKPCTGNSRKIVGKKNISIYHPEKWRR